MIEILQRSFPKKIRNVGAFPRSTVLKSIRS